MFGLAVAWRSNTRGSFLRSLPIIFLGLCNLALFTAAGVFVSKITNANGEVLARGKCGFVNGALTDGNLLDGNSSNVLIANVLYEAAYTSYREESNYARSCYGTQLDRDVTFCNIYSEPFIPSTRTDDAPCPFAEKACLDGAVSRHASVSCNNFSTNKCFTDIYTHDNDILYVVVSYTLSSEPFSCVIY